MRLALDEVLAPVVRYAGNIAADVVNIVVIVEVRHRAVYTTLSLLSILVLGIVLNTPCVEHTSTTVRERNLPKRLVAGCDVVLTELYEV